VQRISEQQILSAIGSFYAAAQVSTREAWLEAWKQLAVIFRSGGGGFVFFRRGEPVNTATIVDLSPTLLDAYFKTHESKSLLRKKMATLKVGESFNRQEHISDSEFVKTEIYEDFYKPAGIFHVEYHVFLLKRGVHASVIFTRPEGEANFDEEDRTAIRVLLPHLERAFQLYASHQEGEIKGSVMATLFDRIATNIIVTDNELKVTYFNKGAEELLARRDGIEIDGNGRLRTHERAQGLLLCKHIKSACRGKGDDDGDIILISRPSGARPLGVLVAPDRSASKESLVDERYALLFISDPEQSPQAVDDVLIKTYGLTRAEARFCALLAEVNDLKAVCDMLDVRISTGRTHLRNIFAKTGTNRQAALIRLILSGPAAQ